MLYLNSRIFIQRINIFPVSTSQLIYWKQMFNRLKIQTQINWMFVIVSTCCRLGNKKSISTQNGLHRWFILLFVNSCFCLTFIQVKMTGQTSQKNSQHAFWFCNSKQFSLSTLAWYQRTKTCVSQWYRSQWYRENHWLQWRKNKNAQKINLWSKVVYWFCAIFVDSVGIPIEFGWNDQWNNIWAKTSPPWNF